jgi:ubiquinone/menaquinone biosynthesis C-methylase UbiE
MRTATYRPGYSEPVLSLMAERSAETHANFFLPQLRPGFTVLDAGCGPGTITLGIARRVAPGRAIGIDVEDSQFAKARDHAQGEALDVEFRQASVYELPFEDRSFDAVFSHALLEHLVEPRAALVELRRVLKPGGWIGVRAGDMGGILVDAGSDGPAQALAGYIATREKNSGDPKAGRKLGRLLRQAGFTVQKMTASYEVITETLLKIGPALAQQFAAPAFCSLEDKAAADSLFVALAWCEAIARVQWKDNGHEVSDR